MINDMNVIMLQGDFNSEALCGLQMPRVSQSEML